MRLTLQPLAKAHFLLMRHWASSLLPFSSTGFIINGHATLTGSWAPGWDKKGVVNQAWHNDKSIVDMGRGWEKKDLNTFSDPIVTLVTIIYDYPLTTRMMTSSLWWHWWWCVLLSQKIKTEEKETWYDCITNRELSWKENSEPQFKNKSRYFFKWLFIPLATILVPNSKHSFNMLIQGYKVFFVKLFLHNVFDRTI